MSIINKLKPILDRNPPEVAWNDAPTFKQETPITELAKKEAQQGTYFTIPVQETPAPVWDDCGVTAMESLRKPRKRSSKPI